MTQEQIIKFKSKLTELANKHKDELTLIKKELTEAVLEIKEEMAKNDEVQ